MRLFRLLARFFDIESISHRDRHEHCDPDRTSPVGRDYSLVGESTRSAVETGLASAEWYHTDMPRKEMKELMQRSDGPAIRDTVIWLAA